MTFPILTIRLQQQTTIHSMVKRPSYVNRQGGERSSDDPWKVVELEISAENSWLDLLFWKLKYSLICRCACFTDVLSYTKLVFETPVPATTLGGGAPKRSPVMKHRVEKKAPLPSSSSTMYQNWRLKGPSVLTSKVKTPFAASCLYCRHTRLLWWEITYSFVRIECSKTGPSWSNTTQIRAASLNRSMIRWKGSALGSAS